jgi:hypothetical protein
MNQFFHDRVRKLRSATDETRRIAVTRHLSVGKSCVAGGAKKGLIDRYLHETGFADNALVERHLTGRTGTREDDLTEKFLEIHGRIEKWNNESGIMNNEAEIPYSLFLIHDSYF